MVSSHNVEFLPDIIEEYRVLLSQLVSIGYNLLCNLNWTVHAEPKRARMVLHQP